jgi:hypothetical protein
MRSLGNIRMSKSVLVLLACVSALATFVIIHNGTARTPAQAAALAALKEPQPAPAKPAPVADTSGSSSTPAAPSGGDTSHSSSGGSDTSAGGGGGSTDSADMATPAKTKKKTKAPNAGLPSVGHVFLIALSAPSYAATFGDKTAAPYLSSLVDRGTVLSGFRSLGHGQLGDEIAMVSGQPPNPDTAAGCETYAEYPPTTDVNRNGEMTARGCVYPGSVITIGDQVTSDGKVWGGYIAGMGDTTCRHPDSNAATNVPLPGTRSGYYLQHNPFIFFHSLLDQGDCASDDQDLTALDKALTKQTKTPRFAYLGPDACSDGDPLMQTSTPAPTATTPTTSTPTTPAGYGCAAGQPSGIAAEDAYLKTWVPKILASSAYRHNGVLVIAFTGTKSVGHPVRTGALVISRYTARKKPISKAYDPYSLLRSIEDMLGDDALARAAGAASFAKRVL